MTTGNGGLQRAERVNLSARVVYVRPHAPARRRAFRDRQCLAAIEQRADFKQGARSADFDIGHKCGFSIIGEWRHQFVSGLRDGRAPSTGRNSPVRMSNAISKSKRPPFLGAVRRRQIHGDHARTKLLGGLNKINGCAQRRRILRATHHATAKHTQPSAIRPPDVPRLLLSLKMPPPPGMSTTIARAMLA